MGIASFVIGIIALIIGFVPYCGIIALAPAIIGLILGIVDLVGNNKSGKNNGMSIAGLVLCALSITIIISYYLLFLIPDMSSTNEINNIANELNSVSAIYDYNYSL
ncbi:MAG TPA: hypothetical protein PK993_00630 [Clostridia bacterium]|nr:hypothetical protein [Clostridia bacterium]